MRAKIVLRMIFFRLQLVECSGFFNKLNLAVVAYIDSEVVMGRDGFVTIEESTVPVSHCSASSSD